MRNRIKLAVTSAAVLLTGASGYGAVDALGLLKKTGPLSADEVRSTAQDFLDSWQEGDLTAAAALTDDGDAAHQALTQFRRGAGTDVSFKTERQDATRVSFATTLRFRDDGRTSTWTYGSSIKLLRDPGTGEPRVAWLPSVVHPKLRKGDAMTVAEAAAPVVDAVDRDGKKLTAKEFPSLAGVLPSLGRRYGDKLGGTPEVEVRLTRAGGRSSESLHVISAGKPVRLRTTLSAKVQRAAERAVKKFPESSTVAVKPSNGEILAVANNRGDGFNAALLGQLAPGSTMKIITAAALLEKGLVTAPGPAPCPKAARVGGTTFHNLDEFEMPGATFSDGFSRSCNTTFLEFADDIDADTLSREAREVFGVGLDWHSGVATFDGSVPKATGAEKAATMIGQGQVQMNPLNLASVAATASTGRFKQPNLVPPDVDGRPLAEAQRSLPDDVARQLRTMLHRTATEGTAAKAMQGLPGDIGAKTGSAEVGGNATSDSWFAGYRDDVAAAAVVQKGGHGGDAAGPLVRDVLETR
ncbi:penicillin-binding transpeptidase domain-containing protein [Streptomyces sp. NBC_00878]|uniref:penicillin-binding transpeptidase domain-containing protein n=1 Tax=Streptomyces sp. NBC_00878 TaxID=2975854 RepID=UPI0022564847|nr:penicillin-binding transpeptidase domain-containing protein [Streptomyces sp. NBC_00878]MCX4904388.1 penicillin-binding transpeptidase domain-containing protein [Streptomyces sp. NBC_00878]